MLFTIKRQILMMKLTIDKIQFSNHFTNDVLPKRAYLSEELLIEMINNPIQIEKQTNGNIKLWGYSSEYKKHIRVILLDDERTVLTAFFDRDFYKKKKR